MGRLTLAIPSTKETHYSSGIAFKKLFPKLKWYTKAYKKTEVMKFNYWLQKQFKQPN